MPLHSMEPENSQQGMANQAQLTPVVLNITSQMPLLLKLNTDSIAHSNKGEKDWRTGLRNSNKTCHGNAGLQHSEGIWSP